MNKVQQAYNDAVDFALDKSGNSWLFLKLWRGGEWDELEEEFPDYTIPDELRNPCVDPDGNTTVVVTYANGSTREFIASDALEALINDGHMFSITTMHSDMGRAEEAAVSKMYAGNPIAALGNMMMVHKNATDLSDDDMDNETKKVVVDIIATCITLLSDEVTSHQSGMTPELRDNVVKLHADIELPPPCPAINASCDKHTQSPDGELNYCTHPDNPDDCEGNCTSQLCPLCTEGG
jgi:hypothetical protein